MRLSEQGALANGLTTQTATDLVWTLNHPAVWHLLCVECGWTAEAYEAWLIGSFRDQVLST